LSRRLLSRSGLLLLSAGLVDVDIANAIALLWWTSGIARLWVLRYRLVDVEGIRRSEDDIPSMDETGDEPEEEEKDVDYGGYTAEA
jgi:hypothetical protein